MPKAKTKGARAKPPQWPPTAVGTMPPPGGRTPSKTRRIISFSAARAGVGKSTLAFYFALTWADRSDSKVVFVTLDSLGIEKYAQRLGLSECVTVEDIHKDPGKKKLITLSSYELGLLPIRSRMSAVKSLPSEFVMDLLAELNATHDLVVDVDLRLAASPVRGGGSLDLDLLDESDQVFWVTLPKESLLRADEEALQKLKQHPGVSFDRFDLVANQIGNPQMSDYASLKKRMTLLGAKEMFAVPYLKNLDACRLENAAENPQFIAAFEPMLRRLESRQPRSRPNAPITGEQRQKALKMAVEAKVLFGEARVKLGFANEESIAIALSKQLGVPYASRENKILKVEKGQSLEKVITESFAREHLVLPLFIDENVLAVAMTAPDNVLLVDNMRTVTRFDIQPFVATKTQILRAIDEFYSGRSFTPFSYIDERNVQLLKDLFILRKEEPWLIAMVASYLRPDLARKLIAALPVAMQAKVAVEALTLRQLTREQVIAIDDDIKENVEFVVGGVERLMAMLDEADTVTRDTILDYLKNEKPLVYEAVLGHIQKKGGQSSTKTIKPARSLGRVVAFTGSKEGAGVSTLVVNLALAWAGSQDRKVIIVHMDPLCRNDLGFALGGVTPLSVASIGQMFTEDPSGLGRRLLGRAPFTAHGVGLMSLADKRPEIRKLSPQTVVNVLEALAESYDVFLDVAPFFPMQAFAVELADLVFWSCLPQRAHFEASYKIFAEMKSLHFDLEKMDLIVNQADQPGAVARKLIDGFFAAMQKKILCAMPKEDLLPEYANTQKILVVESPKCEWVKQLGIPLGRLSEVQPTLKTWDCSMNSWELGE